MDAVPRRPLALAVAVLVAASWGVGCTTSMTNMTSARALDPGEHQVALGGQINVNSVVLSEGISAYDQVASDIDLEDRDEDYRLEESTMRELLDAAVVGALFRPSPTMEAGYRLGITDVPLEGIDLGVRYNGRTVKGNFKLQFWESADETFAGSVDVGYGHQFSIGPSFANYLTLNEWSRSDVDVMVPFGAAYKEIARVYLAPRVVWSHISASPGVDEEFREHVPDEYKNQVDQWFRDEQLVYAGGNIGGMIGYKYAYLALEMSIMHVAFKPEILGRERNLSGLSVTPAAGVVFRF